PVCVCMYVHVCVCACESVRLSVSVCGVCVCVCVVCGVCGVCVYCSTSPNRSGLSAYQTGAAARLSLGLATHGELLYIHTHTHRTNKSHMGICIHFKPEPKNCRNFTEY